MTPEQNKAIVRLLFEEVLPAPTLPDDVDQLVSESFVDHDPAVPDQARGIDSIRATHAFLHRVFEQVKFHIDDIIAEGDKVAVRWSAGRARAIAWFRLEDGKIVDRWAIIAHSPPPAAS
jgi:predicted SnoaL-like aldol condensation-catalyzing enzyme